MQCLHILNAALHEREIKLLDKYEFIEILFNSKYVNQRAFLLSDFLNPGKRVTPYFCKFGEDVNPIILFV